MNAGGRGVRSSTASLVLTCVVAVAACLTASQADSRQKSRDDVLLAHVYDKQPYLCYIEASATGGWYAQNILKHADLAALMDRSARNPSLVIPIFPTVYSPGDSQHFGPDAAYYNYLLKESRIKTLDKVLVVGSGSGADSWVAWLKSRSRVFAIDINPLAVANTRAAAEIGTFPIRAIQGDIGTAELPEDFSGFDEVLWNMPFLDAGDYPGDLFHDHDNGEVLDRFLARLPALLKKDGEAILLNTQEAVDRMHWPNREVVKVPGTSTTNSALYVIVLHH